jgi:hypothetical protein
LKARLPNGNELVVVCGMKPSLSQRGFIWNGKVQRLFVGKLRFLINHRITSLAPNPLIIIHHQVDDRGHDLPHDPGTLGYLAAIDDGGFISFECLVRGNYIKLYPQSRKQSPHGVKAWLRARLERLV